MFTLRNYQVKFNDDIVRELAKLHRIIAQLPTGGGKSKCFISLAQRAMEKGFTVLILTESLKIYEQINAEAWPANINSSVKTLYVQPEKLYLAMAQTLIRRRMIIDQFSRLKEKLLIINDEAHVGTASKLLRQLPDAWLIGFTATPDGRQAPHLGELYKGIVCGPQVWELIQGGHLMPNRYYARVGVHTNELDLKNGEFTEESQLAAFTEAKIYDGLLEDLKSYGAGRKTIIFTSSIKHCEEVYDTLVEMGFDTTMYHSGLENKEYMLARFTKLGECDICVSVAALTKGWDYPPCDLCVLLRSTMSLPLFLQMLGRCSRPYNGKQNFITLDYGENYMRFGLYDMDRDWLNMWKPEKIKKKKEAGVAPVKECPSCHAILPISVKVCPYCGFTIPDAPISKEQGELIEITEKYSAIIGKKISNLTPQELAIFARLKNKKPYAIRIARAQAQKDSEWLKHFANAMGYKATWVNHQMELIPTEPIEYTDITLR